MSKAATKLTETPPTTSVRFYPEHKAWVRKFAGKRGIKDFSEALRQMIHKFAELEGWIR